MIACPNCKYSNLDNSLFCSRCGTNLKGETGQLLAEMREYKDHPKHFTSAALDEKIELLGRLVEDNPPTISKYPGLLFTAMVLMILGVALMVGGIFGIGVSIYSWTSAGIVAAAPPQSLPSDGGPGPAGLLLMSQFSSFGLGLLSIMFIFIGFSMFVNGEQIKLFVDMQENADRQSAALHGIFHLLMAERNK